MLTIAAMVMMATPMQAITYDWNAGDRAVVIKVDGRQALTIDGIGPVGKEVDRAKWTAVGRPGKIGDYTVALTGDDPNIARVSPGEVQQKGRWVGLDLNQYGLAHGQSAWPKTYWLPDADLFLCVWWDWSQSNGSVPDWPEKLSDRLSGSGPFQPAAAMRYINGPDGKHAPMHEVLHVRAARHLWDAALPSLCEPSEYRQEMASMMYLDYWSIKPAADMVRDLNNLGRLIGPYVKVLTILQDWETGGFDSLLPDSVWLPDYPPNPVIGSVADVGRVCDAGKRLGRFGFRTNYAVLRKNSPSYLKGIVGFALGADGKPQWFTQPGKWTTLARRQEDEIERLWHPTAAFTDQLASGGSSAAYLDFDRAAGGDGTMATALKDQRALARLIKDTHHGPLGSETLNQQDLMGRYCDFGDYGIMDGHDRLFSPEYKLRRLQQITVSYGCGLCYRFFELPPFNNFHAGKSDLWSERSKMDDYRACEVMLGNAAYVMWDCPWEWTLTEAMVVGRLQRYYCLQPVRDVEYMGTDGRWRTLEEMVRGGFELQTRPWNQKQAEMARVRVRYANGLTVVVNRAKGDLVVDAAGTELTLPQYGWAAWMPDGAVVAYSAYMPGTKTRVDTIQEKASGLRFINPRGAEVEGAKTLRLWVKGKLVWSMDPTTDVANMGGERIELNPKPVPATDIQYDFRKSMGGWRPAQGILRVDHTPEGVRLHIAGPDPQTYSPPLAVEGKAGDVLEVTMATNAGELGQLYFATTADGISERQDVHFHPQPDGKMHTYDVPVGESNRWAGHKITLVRLDPIHGPESMAVTIQSVRLKRH